MVLRELVQTGYATDRFISERLKPMLRSQFPGAQILVVADPASGQRSSAKTGSSTVEEFKKAKIPIKADGNNEIESRIKPAQYYMMRLTAVGPALILDPSCVKLKRALVGRLQVRDGAHHRRGQGSPAEKRALPHRRRVHVRLPLRAQGRRAGGPHDRAAAAIFGTRNSYNMR
jgi:hypothetical protein